MSAVGRESRVFSRYLLRDGADDHILDTYCAAVEAGAAGPYPEPRAFDRLTARLARIHPIVTRAVDVYARHFCPTAPVRKRLILMLAILESYARPYAELDTVDSGGLTLTYVRFCGAVLGSFFLLASATVLLGPIHLVMVGPRTRWN